jgi:branched-chain amino acid transport system substrate-binding protein
VWFARLDFQEERSVMLRRILFAGVATLALALTSAATPAKADILIGAAGPITGGNAALGAQMVIGAEQAVADINARGGVLGQKVKLELGDDACDPKQAVSIANRYASEGAVFVAGHLCSSSSIPASKVYAEEGVLEITPASTNPRYTDEGSWNTFRTCSRDDQQGKLAGDTLAKEFKDKKVVILHDNSTYGKGVADETKKNMNAHGLQEVLYTAYVPGERDYSALISRLKQVGAEVAYIGGYHPEIGLIARQAKEQGLKLQIVGADALDTSEYWQVSGDAGEGTLFTYGSDPSIRPTAAAVVKEFTDKGIKPEGFSLYTYAAIQVWAEAVKKANTTDARKVAETLKADGPWDTLLGPISYDKKGDVTTVDYVWYIWHNGNYAMR